MKCLISIIVVLSSIISVIAAEETADKKSPVSIDKVKYEDRLYSQGKKSEIGDHTKFDASLRYQIGENTLAKLRFYIDPTEDTLDNKNSKFQFLLEHNYDPFKFGIDLQLNTDSGSSGGTTVGIKQDSNKTFISYKLFPDFKITLFPYNFGGKVGTVFDTWDVTRIYNIVGATPLGISPIQANGESIDDKTIPGVVFDLDLFSNFSINAGVGITTFLAPSAKDFDIKTNPNSTRWERKEDFGYKGGFRLRLANDLELEGKYVGHSKSKETGSLLQDAASIYGVSKISGFLVDLEVTGSHAGKSPYRLNKEGDWFEKTAPYEPLYTDYNLNNENWFGKTDVAMATHIGWEFEKFTPYLLYKYQGKNFVFKERESAHLLRTADDTQSHGGLHRLGVGSIVYAGNFLINAEFEYMQAKNPVFGNSADVQAYRYLSSFKKTDYLATLKIVYKFDGPEKGLKTFKSVYKLLDEQKK